MGQENREIVILGRIGAPFGVRGAMHVQSFTEPAQNLLNYSEWLLKNQGKWQRYDVEQIRPHGHKGFVATLKGLEGRDAAARLTNLEIGIYRELLPELPEQDYYWSDLVGLTVQTTSGVNLGSVKSILETGSNDVLVVEHEETGKEHLIPYIPEQYVLKVDLTTKTMMVDWDPEF